MEISFLIKILDKAINNSLELSINSNPQSSNINTKILENNFYGAAGTFIPDALILPPLNYDDALNKILNEKDNVLNSFRAILNIEVAVGETTASNIITILQNQNKDISQVLQYFNGLVIIDENVIEGLWTGLGGSVTNPTQIINPDGVNITYTPANFNTEAKIILEKAGSLISIESIIKVETKNDTKLPIVERNGLIYIKQGNTEVLLADFPLNTQENKLLVAKIIAKYAFQVGISSGTRVGLSGGKIVSKSPSENPAFTLPPNFIILINSKGGKINSILSNKNALLSTLYHEKIHHDEKHVAPAGYPDIAYYDHAQVYFKQIKHPTFFNTPEIYQIGTLEAYGKYILLAYDEAVSTKTIWDLIDQTNAFLLPKNIQFIVDNNMPLVLKLKYNGAFYPVTKE